MTIHRDVLAKYVTPGCLFVETGTRWGDTVIRAVELGARLVMTCESDRRQYETAVTHLNDALPNSGRVSLYHMEAAPFLRTVALPYAQLRLQYHVVFWLDAHTDTQSPLLGELEEIRNGVRHEHGLRRPFTILIDDMRIVKSGAWGFHQEDVYAKLDAIGPCNAFLFEDGYVKSDILVVEYK